MGKKNKNLNQTRDGQIEDITVVKTKNNKFNVNIGPERSNNSVPKSKKKNRKRDFAGAIIEDTPVLTVEGTNSGEDTNENNTSIDPTDTKIKKKKKKKYSELTGLDSGEHVETDYAIKVNNEKLKSKKKKKKTKDNEDCNQEDLKMIDDKTQKDIMKMEKVSDIPKIQNQDVKKKKKNRSKAKTGAPALNDEEAQVTQEEIDQFCDELDEEDNKQFEDWVKLLDARLSKKPPAKK